MWKQDTGSILVTGVPVERGRPIHIEHEDGLARTDFGKGGKVEVIHTPQKVFQRVHEIMHARHSDPRRMGRQYKGLPDEVWNIVEDARIHLGHWPWKRGMTPEPIKEATMEFLGSEMDDAAKHLIEDPEKRGTWPDFGTRFRQAAILIGMGENEYVAIGKADFVDTRQATFAGEMFGLIRANREGKAAHQLYTVFFPPPPPAPWEDGISTTRESGSKIIPANAVRRSGPQMEIIELPLTEVIREAVVGYRRATSGSRLHRPSLRKPVLPQRLFVRRTPTRPDGTILVDASGSMGDWDHVRRWCEKAPFGTIAYYAGNGKSGWLYVYARNGKRAAKIVKPKGGGNTVDGPAMDWLLTQPKPRRMITDRGFCDAADSEVQVVRLSILERAGEIEVIDYSENNPEHHV